MKESWAKYIKPVKGKELDAIGYMVGIERKKYWWIFKESDKKLRQRIIDKLKWFSREKTGEKNFIPLFV